MKIQPRIDQIKKILSSDAWDETSMKDNSTKILQLIREIDVDNNIESMF
jgi:hypothetical protein